MYKKLISVIALLFCLIYVEAQTKGSLNVSVNTSTAGGNYAPRNVLAIWIEDNSGKFVKTLLAYADKRKTHLNTWEATTTSAGTAFNSVDAITGATVNSHSTRKCVWDGTDYNKIIVTDGEYRLRMELTDKNATGNTAAYSFLKGPNSQNIAPKDVPSFSSVTLNWTSNTTGIEKDQTENPIEIYPNPGKGKFTVVANHLISLQVIDMTGKLVYKGNLPVFDLSFQRKGIYFVTVKTSKITSVKKIILN